MAKNGSDVVEKGMHFFSVKLQTGVITMDINMKNSQKLKGKSAI